MTKHRYLAVAFLMQITVHILLVQTWFTLSMRVDSRAVDLGSFDGATSFPVILPLSLLSLIAILIGLISNGAALYSAVCAAAAANLLGVLVTVPKLLSLDLSALDTQLDRLTGIANTHGLDELAISSSVAASGWVALNLMTAMFLLFSFRYRKSWRRVHSTENVPSKANRSVEKTTASTIDLWDSQRG